MKKQPQHRAWYMGGGGEGEGEEGAELRHGIKKNGGRSQRKDYDTFDSNVQIVSFKEEESEREKGRRKQKRESFKGASHVEKVPLTGRKRLFNRSENIVKSLGSI